MTLLEQFFAISLLVQIFHAIEELATGFHKKWYAFKMPFWVFLLFEFLFEGFWIAVYLHPNFPNRQILQAFFMALMFANGIQHLVWWGNAKKYVPGLLTAPLHIVVFLAYYFRAIF
jgi:hypothetical protein